MPLLQISAKADRVPSSSSSTDETIRLGDHVSKARSEMDVPDDCYYGKVRWNPEATWTELEAKRVARKTDLVLLLPFCLLYIGLQLDRHNMSNAMTDNFLPDLSLTTGDFDHALLLNRIGVMLAEVPTQLLILRCGFERVFPVIASTWGIVSTFQALVNGRATWFTLRFLIGLLEGGWYPGMVHYLGYFYTTSEMTTRLSYLTATHHLAYIVANLSAAGLLKMRGLAGRPGWFWLYLTEGVLTFCLGIWAWLWLPTSPIDTKTMLFKEPRYTKVEEIIIVNRQLREEPSRGHVAPIFSIQWRDVKDACMDKTLWILYSTTFVHFVAFVPVAQYLSITLRALKFETFESNLLMIPSSVISIVTVLGLGWSSRRFNERTWHAIAAHCSAIPCLAVLEALPAKSTPGARWIRYAMTSGISGSPSIHPVVVSWLREASFSIKKGALAIVIQAMLGILGTIAAAHIYQPSDAPYYYTANKALLAVACLGAFLIYAQKLIFKRCNKIRLAKWEAMTSEEQARYQKGTEKEIFNGNKRVDFVYPL